MSALTQAQRPSSNFSAVTNIAFLGRAYQRMITDMHSMRICKKIHLLDQEYYALIGGMAGLRASKAQGLAYHGISISITRICRGAKILDEAQLS